MSDDEITGVVPHFLDDVELIERKRIRIDNTGRKRWSLSDKPNDQEVMEEMGVSLIQHGEDADGASCSNASITKSETRRKRDIENVSPNLSHSAGNSRVKCSPRRNRMRFSPTQTECGSKQDENVLSERSMNEADEETPLPLMPAANMRDKRTVISPGGCSSADSSNWTSRDRLSNVTSSSRSPYDTGLPSPVSPQGGFTIATPSKRKHGKDLFEDVSDEVILQIFKWLPKRSLVRCTLVCRRWHRIASDESLWTRLELGERVISRGALGRILAKKPVVLRLAAAEVGEWSANMNTSHRLQFLDLSMCSIQLETLNGLLARCPALRRLSLETLPVDGDSCRIIGRCARLETLNMTMSTGVEAEGLRAMLDGCTQLQSLNMSWCQLTSDSARVLCDLCPPSLQRLNMAGTRVLTDEMVGSLANRCRLLQELDVSDCTKLTEASLGHLVALCRLEHLAISRCYLLAPLNVWQIKKMPSLQYLDVWGMLPASSLASLRTKLTSVSVNQFMLSAIARPTVGPRRTSIWGIRTRD